MKQCCTFENNMHEQISADSRTEMGFTTYLTLQPLNRDEFTNPRNRSITPQCTDSPKGLIAPGNL